jgi:hypothetical protein
MMKSSLLFRIGMFVMVVSCVFLAACSEDRSGIYVYDQGLFKVKADLRSDGSAEVGVTFAPGADAIFKGVMTRIHTVKNGKWSFSGDQIRLTGASIDDDGEQEVVFRPEPNGDLISLTENPNAPGDRYIKQ